VRLWPKALSSAEDEIAHTAGLRPATRREAETQARTNCYKLSWTPVSDSLLGLHLAVIGSLQQQSQGRHVRRIALSPVFGEG